MAAHSLFSASASPKWIRCAGALALEAGEPGSVSEHAAWGTRAHAIAEDALVKGIPAVEADNSIVEADGYQIEFDDEMAEIVNAYISQVPTPKEGDTLLDVHVEYRVDYADAIGAPAGMGFGTSDFVALIASANGEITLYVDDLKTGRKPVDPDGPQGKLYALGVVYDLRNAGIEPDFISLGIHQFKLSKEPLRHTMTLAELLAWAEEEPTPAVSRALEAIELHKSGESIEHLLSPSTDACRWCKAKHKCPAMRTEVTEVVFMAKPATAADFADIDAAEHPVTGTPDEWLKVCMDKTELVELWLTAVRSEFERRMLIDGTQFEGYKIVEGRQGPRKWTDPKAVEALLRDTMKLPKDVVYTAKLASPTQIEKVIKDGTIGPRQAGKVRALMTRSEGKPHVAPATDPRKAIEPVAVADSFDNLETTQP